MVTELCFADFARCLQKAMQPPNDDKDVVELLLGWITEMPSVMDKKGDPISLRPSLISDLLSRKIDVPKAIKDVCTTKKILIKAKKLCEKQVIPFLNPILSDDMYESLRQTVENDNVLAPKRKKELTDLLQKGEEAEFLGQLLIYVINRENKRTDPSLATDDIPLLAEVGYECPLCHAQLVGYIKTTPVKKYEIVDIFPTILADDAVAEFASIPKPKKINAPGNKIALCRDDAEEYRMEPTVDEYKRLSEIKKKTAESYSMQVNINAAALEEEIQKVIYGLAGITDETSLEELSLDALRIDQKILPENSLLKNDETTRVLRYYNYIGELFTAMERDGTGDFELIASEVKTTYQRLDNGQLTQEEIVDQLAEWIKNKSGVGNKNMRACHIVVAYFIQNCEVFREISK